MKHVGEGVNVSAMDGGISRTCACCVSCSRVLFRCHSAGGLWQCIIDLAGLSA